MHINYIKTNSLILLVLVSMQIGYTQNSLRISGIYKNGNLVNRSDTFLLNRNCQFFIISEDGNKEELSSCVWRFDCLDNDSKYIIDREINNTNDFDFLLDDLNVNSSSLMRITAKDSINVLFQARISCSGQTNSGEKFDLYFPVYLNLLPSIPNVNIFEFSSYFDSYYNALRFIIKLDNIFSDRADGMRLVFKEFDWFYTTTYIYPTLESEFNYDNCCASDSAEIKIYGFNKFGVSLSKALKFNFMEPVSELEEINVENELSFYPNPFNDVLYIKGEYVNIDKLVIADVSGRTVKTINKVESPTIQVADLPQGMYLITVIRKHNSKNKSFKLFKK